MTTRFKNSTIVNATARSETAGKQGMRYGSRGSRPTPHGDFKGDMVKKKQEMEDRPRLFSKKDAEDNAFKSRNPDRAGKRQVLEFRGDAPIRFNPMSDTQEYSGGYSYSAGAFRGGEPKKEVNRFYEKPTGLVEKIKNGKGNPNPFPVKIKTAIKIPV